MKAFLKITCGGMLGVLILLALSLCYFRLQAIRREVKTPQELAPPGGQFVEIEGVQLFVQTAGKPSGPAIVLIHGAGAWSELWKPTLELLANRGYYALALDLPPFGLSTRPKQGYGRQAQARLITGLLDRFKIEKAALIGHATGGQAALTAASLRPSQISVLVLEDVLLDWPLTIQQSPEQLRSTLVKVVNLKPLRAAIASIVTHPMMTDRCLPSMIRDPRRATDGTINDLQRPLAVEDKTEQVSDWLLEVLMSEDHELTNPDFLKKLTVPTLLLWGEEDAITPLAQGQHLQSLLPYAKLIVFSNVGHIPHLEAPDEFHETMVHFLKQFL